MSIVSRYLLRQYAASTAAILLGISMTWTIGDSLFHIDEVTRAPLAALRDTFFRALDMLPVAVPMACVVGVAWSLTRAVHFREITAIRCGGIPLQTALLPLLLATLVLSAVMVGVEDQIIVPARLRLEHLGARSGDKDARALTRLAGRWWYAGEGSIVSAARWDESSQRLWDVSLFDLDPQRQVRRRIEAASARYLSRNLWEFRDLTLLEFPRDGVMVEHKESLLRVDLGLAAVDLQRVNPPLRATSLRQMAQRIREEPDPVARAPLGAAFHARLGQPLTAVVLILFAIRFAIGEVERGDSLARTLLRSFGVVALFWSAWTGAIFVARSGQIPAAVPLWGMLALGLTLGLGRFRQVSE
ncbi:MAG: LptF/LptG family permease [Myxococcota bacterium]